MDKFIYEAKRLAKFRKLDGIVSVLDYFKENNTAYIVMDYIEGITLKKYAKQQGKPLPWEQVLELMHPLIHSLGEIHKNDMIHRDISPDNIMISNDAKKLYLIDFGTARDLQKGTLSVYKKSFYTPLEQQSNIGKQGPWTDVYALCVTMYLCITGRSIPMATDRVLGDEVVLPSELGIAIPEQVEKALMHGLALKGEERIRSTTELDRELYDVVDESVTEQETLACEEVQANEVKDIFPAVEENYDTVKAIQEKKTGKPKKKIVKTLMILLLIVLVGVATIWVMFGNFKIHNKDGSYDVVSMAYGKPYWIKNYDLNGKEIVSTHYYENNIIATYFRPKLDSSVWSYFEGKIEYQFEKPVTMSVGDIKATINYISNNTYMLEWTLINNYVGTVAVKDGKCETEVLENEKLRLKGYVECVEEGVCRITWWQYGELEAVFTVTDGTEITITEYEHSLNGSMGINEEGEFFSDMTNIYAGKAIYHCPSQGNYDITLYDDNDNLVDYSSYVDCRKIIE